MRYAPCQLVSHAQLPLYSPHENNKTIFVRYVLSVHCDLMTLRLLPTHVQITADMKQQLADLVRVSPCS